MLQLWTNLVKEAAKSLPDLDMPVNYMDESRILVPWEETEKLVRKAIDTKKNTHPSETVAHFSKPIKANELPNTVESHWYGPGELRYLDLTRQACPPASPGNPSGKQVGTAPCRTYRVGLRLTFEG